MYNNFLALLKPGIEKVGEISPNIISFKYQCFQIYAKKRIIIKKKMVDIGQYRATICLALLIKPFVYACLY